MATKPANRNADLAAVHIAQKALGLSREDAAALKLAVVGVASAGDMTSPQRRRYLAHLSGLQARLDIANGKKPAFNPDRSTSHRSEADHADDRWSKARALWAALASTGHVHTDTDAALMAYVQRQTHVDHWRFLNTMQINNVIEALKQWCLRVDMDVNAKARHG